MAVTIVDIAREVGKSYQTVSLALNGSKKIKPSTRESVLTAAKRMGYHPSFAGKSLSRGRTMVLRAIIADLSYPFNAQWVLALQTCCRNRGYDLAISNYNYDAELEYRQYERVLTRDCDGVIGEITDFNPLLGIFKRMEEFGIPAVIFGETPGSEQVNVDILEPAIRLLPQIEYLAALGHREIVYAAGGHTPHLTEYVCNLFKSRMAALGLPFSPERNICALPGRTQSLAAAGYACGQSICNDYPHATAIAAENDAVAFGVIRAFKERGRRVPEDISVIGQDNIWLGEYAETSLTTYDLDLPLLAQTAVDLLLDPSRPRQSVTRMVSGRLIVRESTAAPKKIVPIK